MKILSISGDANTIKEGTDAHSRMDMLRKWVMALDIFVWPQTHSIRHIWNASKKNSYDVVTSQDPFWRGLIAWMVARRKKLHLNLQVHTDMSAHSLGRRLMARFLLRRANSVRAVSEKVATQVRSTKTKAKIHVLPIYVDLTRFQNLERVKHDRPTILWIGRFEKEKDPVQAVKVLKAVRSHGIDAVLIMLGAGLQEQVVRDAARGLPVEFPGWQPPEEYLKVADVVLSTSVHESWGASIIEALAAGVPVVAPDVGIAKEAGAVVVRRPDLANTVARVLADKPQASLKIAFLDREEWVKRWKETLS